MYHQQWDLSYQRQAGARLAGDGGLSRQQGDAPARLGRSRTRRCTCPEPPRSRTRSSGALLTLLNPPQGPFYSNITTGRRRREHQLQCAPRLGAAPLRAQLHAAFGLHLVALHAECGDLWQPQQHRVADLPESLQPQRRIPARAISTCGTISPTRWCTKCPKFSNRVVNRDRRALADRRPVSGAHRIRVHADDRRGQFADGRPPGPAGRSRQSVRPEHEFADLDRPGIVRAECRSARFGNAGYNSLIGPGFFDLDANVTRRFQIREHKRFDLRFEFFNLLNHTNFNPPVSSSSSSTFGRIQSAGDPRILQLAAKFVF